MRTLWGTRGHFESFLSPLSCCRGGNGISSIFRFEKRSIDDKSYIPEAAFELMLLAARADGEQCMKRLICEVSARERQDSSHKERSVRSISIFDLE